MAIPKDVIRAAVGLAAGAFVMLVSSSSVPTQSLAVNTDSTFAGPSATPTILLDTIHGSLLSIDQSPDAATPGAYVLTVSGGGEYRGVATLEGPQSHQELHGSGPATFFTDGAAAPVTVTISVEGHINISSPATKNDDSSRRDGEDPKSGSVAQVGAIAKAEIVFTVECQAAARAKAEHEATCPTYRVETSEVPTDQAGRVVDAVSTALLAKDWRALYRLETADLTANASQESFTKQMAAQGGNLVRIVRGKAAVTTVLGHIYFDRQVTVTAVKADGSSATFDTHIGLVLEQGEWRFYGTDSPPGS